LENFAWGVGRAEIQKRLSGQRFGDETAMRLGECTELPRDDLENAVQQKARSKMMSNTCRICGSRESQTIADARTLGLLNELQSGVYTCCQIVAWADEQWLAWAQAAEEDGKWADDVTRPLESAEAETVIIPIRLRRWENPPLGNPFDFR
jgi:hypothetical protein